MKTSPSFSAKTSKRVGCLNKLEKKEFEDLNPEKAIKIKDSLDRKIEDYYIYVGTSGYAVTYWRLARYFKE